MRPAERPIPAVRQPTILKHAAAVLAAEAKAIADQIDGLERKAVERWLALLPLRTAWFPTRPGSAGAPLAVDAMTAATIGRMPARLIGLQESPMARQAREQAAAERWKNYFDRLLTDADAPLDGPAPKSTRKAA